MAKLQNFEFNVIINYLRFMITVTILGSGNVAMHLTRALLKTKHVRLVQVYSRNIKNIRYLEGDISITDDITTLKKVAVYIIAISDDAIHEFSNKLNVDDALVIHTSGSISMDDLKGTYNKGVFYPLQTFSKQRKISFKKIPICIEADSEQNLVLLEKLASAISNHVYIIDSEQRQKLHLAAVFVNNFVNHLYQIGSNICEENQVPFEILHPLIKETAKKIQKLTPIDAQTGPAKRNDTKTIEKHLSQLKNQHQEIYKILTKSIISK